VTSVQSPSEIIGQATGPTKKRSPLRILLLLLVVTIVIDVLALLFVPPFDKEAPDSGTCPYPVCFIDGNLHLPAPHVVWSADGDHGSGGLLTFEVSITDSLLTMFIITVTMLIAMILLTRRRDERPGRVQNAVEWAYEALDGFAKGMGGAASRRYVPLFASFFILILAFNWSGLIPVVGRVDFLRAPTSDLNVTIGLALVAFFTFHVEGVRRLGAGGYLSKFFPLYEFRNGIGAGVIALFVGLVELLLEFVKPLTLSMRLFGNIYGGETALAVLTALTIGVLPVALYGLEVMLTFVQALIFSTLTLMFVIAAVESHHHEEGEMGHEAVHAVADATHHPAPSGAH
jgi:F-type H+-transporting ATPase subunit a